MFPCSTVCYYPKVWFILRSLTDGQNSWLYITQLPRLQTLAAQGWHRISFSCICILSVLLARWSTRRTFLSPVGRISPSFLHGSRCRTPRDGLVLRRSAVGMLINGSRSARGDWWKIVIASLHWTAYSIEVLKGWDWNKWSRAVSWMGMLVVNGKFAFIFCDFHYSIFSSLPIRKAMLL